MFRACGWRTVLVVIAVREVWSRVFKGFRYNILGKKEELAGGKRSNYFEQPGKLHCAPGTF
jgi:hypothetical protein